VEEQITQGQFILRATPKQFSELLMDLKDQFAQEGFGTPFEVVESDQMTVKVLCHPTTSEEQRPVECVLTVQYIDANKSLLTAIEYGVIGHFVVSTLRLTNLALFMTFYKLKDRGWLHPETSPDDKVDHVLDFRVGASPEAVRAIVCDYLKFSASVTPLDAKQEVYWCLFDCTDLGRSGNGLAFDVSAHLYWDGRNYDASDKHTAIAEFGLMPLTNSETRGEVILWYNTPTMQKVLRDAVAVLLHKVGGSILPKKKRMFGLQIGYLIAGIALCILIIVASLILFPDWARSNFTLVVLIAVAFGVATQFIANFRKAYE
jgi:hypothetical protein